MPALATAFERQGSPFALMRSHRRADGFFKGFGLRRLLAHSAAQPRGRPLSTSGERSVLDELADQIRNRLRRLLGYVTGEYSPLPTRPDDLPTPSPRHATPPADLDRASSSIDQVADDDFDTMLREGRIRTEYQPIVSLVDGSVIGYEALSRGPIGTRLESATALFDAARRRGVGPALERLCRFRALAGASSLPPGCYLFLNISPHVLEERHGGLSH